MLQILRNKAQSTVIQIIVVVIALVFIFWGVGTNLDRNRQAALTVNGEEISFQSYQQAYDRAYQRLANQFGGNLPKGLAETLNIKQQVINQLVQAALLRQGAREMGITLSNNEIRKIIEGMVQFQKDGHFDMERYQTILAANRMAPTKFEDSLRIERLAEVASREISNFVTVATDYEIQDIYGRLNEQIEVDFVEFSPKDYLDKVSLDGLEEWFESHKDNYKTPRQLKLRYLPFLYAEIGKKIEIDPARIEEYYAANSSAFAEPEQRKARHILLSVTPDDPQQQKDEKRAKAEELLARARGGENFSELAKNNSEGPSKAEGGELGWFDPDDMVPAFAQAVRGLKPGEISDIVETRFGYHIILLEDIRPPRVKVLSEVKDQIIAELRKKEATALAFQMANSAYEGIIGKGSLQSYIDATPEAVVRETDFFTRDKGPAELKNDPAFLDSAFKLNKGELSSLVKGQSGYVIFYVDDVREPQVPPLADVRKLVETDFRTEQAANHAKEAATALLVKLQSGTSLKEAAASLGLKVENSGPFKQNDPTSATAFPSTLSETAFLLSEKEPLPKEPGLANGKYYVYSFVRRTIPTMPEDSDEKSVYRQNLIRLKQQQLLQAWLRNMEAGAEVTKSKLL